jgi:DNA polymerase/3'-5' exonuclease PolX
LAEAERVARSLLEVLGVKGGLHGVVFKSGRVIRIEVAGSVRRRRPDVGDIEIVYVPRIGERPGADMFAPERVNLADEAIEDLIRIGVLEKRLNAKGTTVYGPQNKLLRYVASGIHIDLFATTEDSWFNYLVCRTGPAALNQLIAAKAKRMGWHWNPYGPGFSRGKNLKLGSLDEEVVRMVDEKHVFQFVDLPYLEPWER